MCNIHTLLLYFLKKLRREVKSCGRCGSRSLILCIYSLITVLILQLVGNIRRQRHFSQLIQDLFENPLIMELDQTVSLIYNINDLTLQDTVTKSDLCTRTCFFSRLYKTLPDIIFAAFQKQDLDQRSCLFLVTIKTCRDNLGIIDHKTVSLMQVIQYIGKMTMFDTSIFQGQMHQSGRTSVLQRILSDQFLRQIIIKI